MINVRSTLLVSAVLANASFVGDASEGDGQQIEPMDGFSAMAIELDTTSAKRPGSVLAKKCRDKCTPEQTKMLEAETAVLKVLQKAYNSDNFARVTEISQTLARIDRDMSLLRARKGLTPETIALASAVILSQNEEALDAAGGKELTDQVSARYGVAIDEPEAGKEESAAGPEKPGPEKPGPKKPGPEKPEPEKP